MLSVVVPCLDEEAVIQQTHRRLVRALEPLGAFEVLYVDDGSRDRTAGLLRAIAAADPRVRVLVFSRNFGQQVALTAGLEHARGDAVVFIDADLQDPPEVIADFVSRWKQGADVVYGVRTDRAGEGPLKRGTAALFYRVFNALSDWESPRDTGDFRLMDRKVVDALRALPERHRFMRSLVSWVGFHQEPVPYRREARVAGTTKYSFSRMLGLAMDALVSSSAKPLRLAGVAGGLTTAVALAGLVVLGGLALFGRTWSWLAAGFFALLFVGGVQLVCVGLLGEYVGRIYGEVRERPLYLLRETIGLDAPVRTPTDRT